MFGGNINLISVTKRKDAMKMAGLVSRNSSALCGQMSGAALARRDGKLSRLATSRVFLAVALILLILLSACTSESNKPAETKAEVKGPELITALSAFRKFYVSARGWQADAKPYRLESVVTSDGNGHDGKCTIWRGGFASPNMRLAKTYTWSGSAASDAPERGVNPGIQDSYSPTNSSMQVFDMPFLKVDSDQAFAAAQKHGGDEILGKEPDTPVSYVCDWNRNTNELVWHVIYGASRETAKLTVAVDASSGEFIRVEK